MNPGTFRISRWPIIIILVIATIVGLVLFFIYRNYSDQSSLVKQVSSSNQNILTSKNHRNDVPNLHNVEYPKNNLVVIKLDGIGSILLRLKPQFSNSSTKFWETGAHVQCTGNIYRNEQSLLLQGRLDCAGIKMPVVQKGNCPQGTKIDSSRSCPPHDPECGCHGPIMRKGMVGWAGGGTGPDFFIYTGVDPATHWNHDHTVFAEVEGSDSWRVLEKLHELPSRQDGEMIIIESPVHFRLEKLVQTLS